jgi:hypothetical protein
MPHAIDDDTRTQRIFRARDGFGKIKSGEFDGTRRGRRGQRLQESGRIYRQYGAWPQEFYEVDGAIQQGLDKV